MKKLLFALPFALAACSPEATSPDMAPSFSVATAPGQNKLTCFSGADNGYNGVCTMSSNGAKKASATLNNIDGDDNPYNNYSGVQVGNNNLAGKSLASGSNLSFSYTGEATTGSPRFLVTVADGTGDLGVVFVAAYYCNDGAGNVDAINDATCTIFTNFSGESWANWAAMVAAHPDWKFSSNDKLQIVADDPGMWTLSNVKFGTPGK